MFVFLEEADDDDDPEYNFLDDLDEPDLEDYRTDRAVQITSRCFRLGPCPGLVQAWNFVSTSHFLLSFIRSELFFFLSLEKEVNELLDELFDTVSLVVIYQLVSLLISTSFVSQHGGSLLTCLKNVFP